MTKKGRKKPRRGGRNPQRGRKESRGDVEVLTLELPPDIPKYVSNLIQDVYKYEQTKMVPDEIRSEPQAPSMYEKLVLPLKELREKGDLPKTEEMASTLIINTLQTFNIHDDIEVLLRCYNYPLPRSKSFEISFERVALTHVPQFTLKSFPITRIKNIPDGDGFTALAEVTSYSQLPSGIMLLWEKYRSLMVEGQAKAATIVEQDLAVEGYSVSYKTGALAKQYHIRLRGIDAPELLQDYGREARQELINIIRYKHLRIEVYYVDPFRRYISDVYCEDKLVQEILLKKGAAWYAKIYDDRAEFAEWHEYAHTHQIGLWKDRNAISPWDWKETHKREKMEERFKGSR